MLRATSKLTHHFLTDEIQILNEYVDSQMSTFPLENRYEGLAPIIQSIKLTSENNYKK